MSQRIVVFHDWYGCDTGCCGHVVVLYNGTTEVDRTFHFLHLDSNQSKLDFVTDLAQHEYPGIPIDVEASEVQECW